MTFDKINFYLYPRRQFVVLSFLTQCFSFNKLLSLETVFNFLLLYSKHACSTAWFFYIYETKKTKKRNFLLSQMTYNSVSIYITTLTFSKTVIIIEMNLYRE